MRPEEIKKQEKTADYLALACNPAASVFVSANAGAGKTTLLASRVLSLLLHGVMPSKILCLTFTNAAAAEMSSRVLRELGRWVMMDEVQLTAALSRLLGHPPDKTRLSRARGLFALVLESPEGIRIQTIHGFCQSLLARFPLEAGISPHFSIMDTRTQQEMLTEARIRLFSHAQHDEMLQSAIYRFAQHLSETGLEEVMNAIVESKKEFTDLLAGPGGIEEAARAIYHTLGVDPTMTLDALCSRHFGYDESTRALLRKTADRLLGGKKTDSQTGEGIIRWLTDKTRDISGYQKIMLTEKGDKRARLFTKDQLTDAACIEALLAEQERVHRFTQELRSFDVAEATVHMLYVAEALLAIYDKLKRSHARMDYDDLILTSCDLLSGPGIASWVLFKLDGGIDHVLVDEAQDTSPVQWSIVKTITHEFFSGLGRSDAERSLFIVGDEKQSIFSFQGADVAALGLMQQYFLRRIHDAGMQAQQIALTRSFRSLPTILRAVDLIFAREQARSGLMFAGGVLEHIPTRSGEGLVELHPIMSSDDSDALAPSVKLARHLAQTIGGWIEKGEASAGDVMILVRTRTPFVDQLTRALKRARIPVTGSDRMELGDNLAVQDLMALGEAVLLPEDSLNLAALLKSPLFDISEEQLFTLAHDRGEKTLWERLRECSGDHASFAGAYELLSDIRARADYDSPFALYSYALDSRAGRARMLGRMGEEYADAMDEFLAQTLLYERGHTPSLQGFIHWMRSSSSEIKRDMEHAGNQVRIMTVHGAKGLQAPIVILPDTIELPKMRDTLLWDEEGSLSLPLWPVSSALDDAHCAVLRAEAKQRMLAEYRRLLYVALTRAENRLYVTGYSKKEKLPEGCWYQLIKDALEPQAVLEDEVMRLGSCHSERSEESMRDNEKILRFAQNDKEWECLNKPAPDEPTPTRPLSPSHLPGVQPPASSPLDTLGGYQRGTLIHRLLQYLPAVAAQQRPETAQRIAKSFRKVMDEALVDSAIGEALALMENKEVAFLFSPEALAEVPVAGTVTIGGKPVTIAGQIDRLHIGANDVWIIDFKSNHQPPDSQSAIPVMYIRQLALYQRLLAAIYPAKTIRCALLWTVAARLDELAQPALDEALATTYI